MGAALEKFKESLKLASALKELERDKFNKVKQNEQHYIMGLRGGAAVLMVAAFEFYIRRLFEENISSLNTNPLSIDISKLPDRLKVKIVFDGLQNSMNGPRYGPKTNKVDRINDVTLACKHLIAEHINPQIFSDTNSNPNGETVKEKFKEIGISDVFTKIKINFERKWGSNVAATFIEDKLNEIVNIRHVVAHTANTLNITKKFQNEALKFLKIIAELLEKEIEIHIKGLLISAKR